MSYIGKQPFETPSSFTATANGAISEGDPCIIEADGDIAAVAAFGTGIPTVGTAASASDTVGQTFEATFDSSQNVAIYAYHDPANSYYGTVVAFSISGGSITAGTPTVFATDYLAHVDITYDANAQKSVLFYYLNTSPYYGKCRVVTASGTTLTFGTETNFKTDNTRVESATYDENAQKVVVFYSVSPAFDLKAVVGTISGTSITFGSEASAITGTFYGQRGSAVYLPSSQKVLIVTEDFTDNDLNAIVGTVSGTSISFGSVASLAFNMSNKLGLAVDNSDNVFILSADDDATGDTPHVIGGSVSGTTFTFGTPVEVSTTDRCIYPAAVYDSDSDVFAFFYRELASTSSGIKAGTATVSGGTASVVATGKPVTTYNNFMRAFFVSSENKTILLAYNATSPYSIDAYPVTTNALTQNLTAENFIGFAAKDAADTADVTVQLSGAINNAQTGLTAGQKYYVQSDGSLDTTADDPSVVAGVALSATEIAIDTSRD